MESVDNLKERFNGLTEGIFEPEELECLKKEVNLKTITGRYSVIRNLYARLDNPAISEGLKDYRYDEMVEEGKMHSEKIKEMQLQHIKLQREKKEATWRYNNKFAQAQRQYSDYIKLARIVFRENPVAQLKLELKGRRNRSFSLWLAQAKAFYHNALEESELSDAFHSFGIANEKLTEALALVEETENSREDRNLKQALAQEGKMQRNEALRSAEFWRMELIALAEMALDPRIAIIISAKKLTLDDPDTE
ncbi:MAG: hypothetical protein GY757_25235 [bacterium]|nr:hypothetical protein [bacterium]